MNLPDFFTQDKYGYIHLAGHRIGLMHVVDLYKEGYSPEMLLDHFPTLSLALLHKVIAFYLENQAEVDAYIAQCRAEIDRQAAAPQPGPDLAELRQRMEARRRAESA
jgi:uncharacterized protein (DUF433 family)